MFLFSIFLSKFSGHFSLRVYAQNPIGVCWVTGAGVGEHPQGGLGVQSIVPWPVALTTQRRLSEGTGETILALGRLKIPAVPLTRCVILGKLLHQPEPQFFHLCERRITILTF